MFWDQQDYWRNEHKHVLYGAHSDQHLTVLLLRALQPIYRFQIRAHVREMWLITSKRSSGFTEAECWWTCPSAIVQLPPTRADILILTLFTAYPKTYHVCRLISYANLPPNTAINFHVPRAGVGDRAATLSNWVALHPARRGAAPGPTYSADSASIHVPNLRAASALSN